MCPAQLLQVQHLLYFTYLYNVVEEVLGKSILEITGKGGMRADSRLNILIHFGVLQGLYCVLPSKGEAKLGW